MPPPEPHVRAGVPPQALSHTVLFLAISAHSPEQFLLMLRLRADVRLEELPAERCARARVPVCV
jgi:hypothetical protein